MKKKKNSLLKILTFLLIAAGLVSSTAVFAQDGTASVSIWVRILQVLGVIGALATLGGIIYGAVVLRNAAQANDVLLGEKGRRLAVISGIFFFVSLVIVIVSFFVIGQRRQPSELIEQIESIPSGQQAASTRDSLILTEAIPFGTVPVRNAKVQLLFNQPVAEIAVTQHVRVLRQADGTEVNGTWEVDGNYAAFTPTQTCPTPNTSLACFDAQTIFEIHINLSLTSEDGDVFRCSLEASAQDCFFTFTTGTVIDTQAPTVAMTLPYDQEGVPFDASVLLEALAGDDLSVATIHFFADDRRVGVASVQSGELLTQFRGATSWDTSGLQAQTTHTLRAEVYDLAGLSASSEERSIEILPLFCYDEAQNEDEEAVDCGGNTCRACEGAVCEVDADCASNLCFEGTCRRFPLIQEMIDADGAPGNYVSIRGQNFGAEPGEIIFLGEAGDEDDLNGLPPACEVYWTPSQVVIEIPENVAPGPIRLVTADGLFDVSDDNKGSFIEFTPTQAVRPGLCPVFPEEQIIGETIQLTGKNLGEEAGTILFGQLEAEEFGTWLPTGVGEIVVPQVDLGEISLKIETEDEISNPVFFTVRPSPVLPRIAELSPNVGPAAQMITVRGENFDRTFEVVFLNLRTGEEVNADTQLPEICAPGQTTRQRAVRVPRVEPGSYQVYVQTEAGRSNAQSFRVNEGERIPGLCALIPDNGPAGLEVTLYGENFGQEEGGVRFAPRIDDAPIVSWTERQASTTVPASTVTGPVQMYTAQGTLSNPFQFTVGQCSPDTCEEGFECCGNGACQKAGTCVDSVPFCTYSWLFSTGDNLNGPPRVIEDASCRNSTQSPSPYRDTRDACLNASISARFTQDMQDQTLRTDHVTLRRCGTGATFDPALCEAEVNIGRMEVINSNQPGEGFIAVPQGRMSPDTWYQVELSTGFTAENGFSLASPYIWSFKTQPGDSECTVDHIEVTPATATIEQIGGVQRFTGVPTALNCNILDPDSYQWGWLSSNTGQAVVSHSRGPRADARAVSPTEPGPPVEVIGEIPAFSEEDSGSLSILLRPPVVVDQFPNCTVACPNAMIGARFDQPMQEGSVTSGSNVSLFECASTACARDALTNVAITQVRYNDTDRLIVFAPDSASLRSGATYRTVLSGNMRSSSGIALGDLNYDRDGDGNADSYSWIFTVKPDGSLCAIDRVTVIPEEAESHIIGEEFDYFGFPVSAPDECSADGQLLNPESFEWGWGSTDEQVGTVSEDDLIAPDGFVDPYQITTSVGEGEAGIQASAEGQTGEGNFRVVCGYETDNDCPSPATPQTHGVGQNSCCYERPSVQSFNPKAGAENVCTTAAAEIQFDQVMDTSSLTRHIFLEVNNGSTPCPGTEAAETTALGKIKHLALTFWHWLVPSSQAQGENWCVIGSGITVSQNEIGSVAKIVPLQPMAATTQHRVRVSGDLDIADGTPNGVRNAQGVTFFGETNNAFTTSDAECTVEFIEVIVTPPGEPSPQDVFFCAGRNDCDGDVAAGAEGNQHEYQAIARDAFGYVVPADFRWIVEGDDILTLSAEEGETIQATAAPQNGDSTITVFASAQAPSTGIVSRSLDVEVFLCENPWPSITEFPYIDNDFGYFTFYCRDAGEPGTADDLPPLSSPITGGNIGAFLQDSLFIVED